MTNDSNYNQGFPRLTAEMVDPETGRVTEPWVSFFISLWNRTGAGPGSNVNIISQLNDGNALSLDGNDERPILDQLQALLTATSDHDANGDTANAALELPSDVEAPTAENLNSQVVDAAPDPLMVNPFDWLLTDQDADPVLYNFPPLGRVSGVSYPAWDGNVAATGLVGAADTIYLYPFFLDEDIVVSALFLRVVTVGSAGAAGKAAIWSSKNGRPVGPPLIADNTGSIMTATGIVPFTITATLLRRGWYWLGTKFSSAAVTQPVCTNIVGTSLLMASRIGGTTTGNAILNGATNQMSGMSFADAYANTFPDLTGAGLVNVVVASSGIPVLGFTVG